MKKKILSLAIIAMLIASLFVLTGCGDQEEEKDSSENEVQNVAENIYSNAVNTANETNNDLDSAAESKWNDYEGEQTGAKVQSLIALVVTESKSSDNDEIEVEFGGETYKGSTEIAKCKTKVAAAKKYKVSFEFDDGNLEKVIIE